MLDVKCDPSSVSKDLNKSHAHANLICQQKISPAKKDKSLIPSLITMVLLHF